MHVRMCAGSWHSPVRSTTLHQGVEASFYVNSSSIHSTAQPLSCDSAQHQSIWLGEYYNIRPKKVSACQVDQSFEHSGSLVLTCG